LTNVPVRDVQADEIWSFVGKKEKWRRPGDSPMVGDCYTFIAMETHTKLVLNVTVGRRDQANPATYR
jgi:IS1 family transposase